MHRPHLIPRRLDRMAHPSAALRADLDLAVIAENEPVRLGHLGRRGDLDLVPDQRRLDPRDSADRGPASTIEYSISLSSTMQPGAIEVNGPTYESVTSVPGPMIAGPDDPRAAYLGAGLDDHPADELAAASTMPIARGFGALKHHPVDLQHVRDVAGVFPVTGDDAWTSTGGRESISHWIASVISSSPRHDGLRLVDRLVHRRREHVHADKRQIALGLLRLLLKADHPAVRVQLGDAELRAGRLPGSAGSARRAAAGGSPRPAPRCRPR